MSIVLPTSSRQLRLIHWAPGQAIRSGASPNQAVGTQGIVEETHHAYAYAIQAFHDRHHPAGVALATNSTATLTTYDRAVIPRSPGILRFEVDVDCEDCVVGVTDPAGTVLASTSVTTRAIVTLNCAIGSTRVGLLKMYRNVTTGVIYGATWYEDVMVVAELPT